MPLSECSELMQEDGRGGVLYEAQNNEGHVIAANDARQAVRPALN
jgi:hypothetical protein